MKKEMFADLMGSTREALEHARGKRSLRTTTLPLPLEPFDGRRVKYVRATLRASQAVFASYLNVSTKLVQAWEGDRRSPEGPALVLLHLAARQPELLERVSAPAPSRTTRRGTSRQRVVQAATHRSA